MHLEYRFICLVHNASGMCYDTLITNSVLKRKEKNTFTFFFFTFGALAPQIMLPIAITIIRWSLRHFNLSSVLTETRKKSQQKKLIITDKINITGFFACPTPLYRCRLDSDFYSTCITCMYHTVQISCNNTQKKRPKKLVYNKDKINLPDKATSFENATMLSSRARLQM